MKLSVRILSWVLALCCLVGMIPGLSFRAAAYASAKPLPELTGNKGQDVANIAMSQLGYKEDSSGTVYGAWWKKVTNSSYNFTTAGWCAMFAMWCADQAGAGLDIAYNKSGAQPHRLMEWQLANASGDTSFSVAPQPGDFIFFSEGSKAEHVAIVVSYDASTNKVTFVGGNQGNKVTQFTMSYTASAKFGYQRIIAIGRPKYGSSAIVPTCSCNESYAGSYQNITQSDSLNIRGGHGTSFSVVGTIPKGAVVHVSKAQGVADNSWAHVEYNGIKGFCSMQYLKKIPEYNMEVVYDEHTGNVTGANVEIYEHATENEFWLALPEQLVIGPGEVSAPIRITAPNGLWLNLEIPLVGDFSQVKPFIIDKIGQAIELEEYSYMSYSIAVRIAGTVELRLENHSDGHSHSYDRKVTVEPTCEDQGEATLSCTCGDTYTQPIAATGHSEQAVAGKKPTCTEPGLTEGKACATCGKVLAEQEEISPLGHSFAQGICTVCGAEDPDFVKVVTLSGSYKAFGNEADIFSILLLAAEDGEVVYEFTNEQTPANTGVWRIEGVQAGNYILQVTKRNHAAREYTLIVGDSDVTLDVEIWLLGDVNGDGLVNFADYSKVLRQSKNPSGAELADYAWLCGDVTGDGLINFSDYGKVLAQAKGHGDLWQ